VTGARIRIERAHEVGLVARGTASVRLEDVTVIDTLVRDCGIVSCDVAAGMGVGAYDDSQMSLTRLEVRNSPLCGVQIHGGAALDLDQGLVAQNQVGACVQIPGYDVARLTSSVRYEDNVVNVDAAADFPIPEARLPEM
jgi:hypothetical protein